MIPDEANYYTEASYWIRSWIYPTIELRANLEQREKLRGIMLDITLDFERAFS